jgi:hypothetical protein
MRQRENVVNMSKCPLSKCTPGHTHDTIRFEMTSYGFYGTYNISSLDFEFTFVPCPK